MTVIELLRDSPGTLIAAATVLGLLVGSFLNVVIYRLPRMLERGWRTQCRELLEPAATELPPVERFDLVAPRSHCPHCGHVITAWENIPLLSYLWLRGRCAECREPIPLRYPFVELLTGVLSGLVAWQFGFSVQTAAALPLTWGLLALSVIDLDHKLLPDVITLPLLWLGLLLSLVPVFAASQPAIVGAAAGYVVLWGVYQAFKAATGKEGMGYGDFKLLAMLGGWFGWQALPLIVLLSSLVGAVSGTLQILLRGHDRSVPIPFGPYLAAAGWMSLMWGEPISHAYLRWAGWM